MTTTRLDAIAPERIAAARSRFPAAFARPSRERWLVRGTWIAVLVYLLVCFWAFEFHKIFAASEQMLRLLKGLVVWNDFWSWDFPHIFLGIAQTLAMAFLGTLLASLFALLFGFLGARNTVRNVAARHLVRRFLDILRGIDQLIWALVFVRAIGLGPLSGVLAIMTSDTGTLGKLYAEAIENIDRKQVEGVRATGASPVKTMRYGVFPQVFPVFLSQSLYFLESNTRTATILGIVGAGGVGMIIAERFKAQLYDQVAFVVLCILALIWMIDSLSWWLRRRFIGPVRS